jgi:predicted sulfurtransferase
VSSCLISNPASRSPKSFSGIYLTSKTKEQVMAEGPKITTQELKRRMQAGEDFTVLDVRNPTAWTESDVKARGAIRVPLDSFEQLLPRIPKSKPIVTYCT